MESFLFWVYVCYVIEVGFCDVFGSLGEFGLLRVVRISR